MKNIYLDSSATTPLSDEVFLAMKPYFSDNFANASSIHQSGYKARQALAMARKSVAKILGCQADEIIFTSGGSESNNLALRAVAEAKIFKGHIITSSIEHHSVLDTIKHLEKGGVSVTYLKPDKFGIISPKQVKKAIRKNTFLISIMQANNEIGAIQPISEIGNIAQKAGILMHTDSVQVPGALSLNVNQLHVNLLSLSAHKFYGPKGVGVLYVRRGTKLAPQILGGGQERGLRSGTENLPAIIGLAKALELAEQSRKKESARLFKLKDWLISAIKKQIPLAILTGHEKLRLPGLASFIFPGVEGEMLVLRLSEKGYDCSTGSACATGNLEPSHVLLALGFDKNSVKGSLRISLGKDTKKSDLVKFVKTLKLEAGKLSKK